MDRLQRIPILIKVPIVYTRTEHGGINYLLFSLTEVLMKPEPETETERKKNIRQSSKAHTFISNVICTNGLQFQSTVFGGW